MGATGPTGPDVPSAWVNFDGTGTVTIRAQVNVSSVTDNGTGDYTITFVTAFADTNYAVFGTLRRNDNTARAATVTMLSGGTKTTTQLRIRAVKENAAIDSTEVNVVVLHNT